MKLKSFARKYCALSSSTCDVLPRVRSSICFSGRQSIIENARSESFCSSLPSTTGRSFSPSLAAMELLMLLLIADVVSSITIGTIENYTYTPVNAPSLAFNATTCDSCLCNAFLHHSQPFVALNCFNHGQLCELFFNYSTPFSLLPNQSSTFYFYPNPPPIATTPGRMSSLLRPCKHHPHAHAFAYF